MGDEGENVKVAVRVRPFNDREKGRNSTLIIGMQGKTTTIKDPSGGTKNFSFDYSYWSHDGFTETSDHILEASDSKYATQKDVFDDLGRGVLNNAFDGYNCSLFAYGQTGSGKSYSMVGYGPNKGIVPITCDELFKTIEANTDPNKKFEVRFSMLEIYNEQVRDLLQKNNPKGGLKVRQNPKEGSFYVAEQKTCAVGSYIEIEKKMAEGTASRTVAATQMNATSSRAHTVVTVRFDQISKSEDGQEMRKTSVMNLVDLAGSERAGSTGATGDRLKEGANINKSLSSLGNVISALVDQSKGKKIVVPYRDSVLTMLLKSALGGNSKTIMIAALSPADINYDETLSTLRYADRAKQIKNKAVINENPLEKMIRELKEENEKLKALLGGGGIPPTPSSEGGEGPRQMTPEEEEQMRAEMMEEVKAQLMANQDSMNAIASSYDEELEESRHDSEEAGGDDNSSRKDNEPHFINLNEDPQLSCVLVHFLQSDVDDTTIGRNDPEQPPHIILTGVSIQKLHATLSIQKDNVIIKPGPGADIKVNGALISLAQTINDNDRVLFGSNQMYVFHNPLNPTKCQSNIDWDFAQKEIAEASGLGAQSGLSADVQEEIVELLPMVSEVNAVSEEFEKQKSFELVLLAAQAQSHVGADTRVMIKMTNLLNGNTWLWERGKFLNRRYIIQDLYRSFLDGEEGSFDLSREEDPFWEPTEDILIGNCTVFLQSLMYKLEIEEDVPILDYKGKEEGKLTLSIHPCDEKGNNLDEFDITEEPDELLGLGYNYRIEVKSAEIKKARFCKGSSVKYRLPTDQNVTVTDVIEGSLSPTYNHSRIVKIYKVDRNTIEYFNNGTIVFGVYGLQEDKGPAAERANKSTKELRKLDSQSADLMSDVHDSSGPDSNSETMKVELAKMKRKCNQLELRQTHLQELCGRWQAKQINEHDYDTLLKEVACLAFSDMKLKAAVTLMTSMMPSQSSSPGHQKKQIGFAAEDPQGQRSQGQGHPAMLERSYTSPAIRTGRDDRSARSSNTCTIS